MCLTIYVCNGFVGCLLVNGLFMHAFSPLLLLLLHFLSSASSVENRWSGRAHKRWRWHIGWFVCEYSWLHVSQWSLTRITILVRSFYYWVFSSLTSFVRRCCCWNSFFKMQSLQTIKYANSYACPRFISLDIMHTLRFRYGCSFGSF